MCRRLRRGGGWGGWSLGEMMGLGRMLELEQEQEQEQEGLLV